MPDGQMWIEREPENPRWWQLRVRASKRRYPLPDPQQGELYVQYAGERDPWGNVRFVLYWNEPWARLKESGVTAGTLRCQAFLCDERPFFRQWLAEYERVVLWPDGDDITEAMRALP
jgi:hypothetical protein